MAQAMMWDPLVGNYRGQATNGTVVTVDEDAMALATRMAGKGVYDSDWWVETLARVLEHWGIYGKQWIDGATKMPRSNFATERQEEKAAAEPPPPQQPQQTSMPSGPLSKRLMSGPLSKKDVEKDMLKLRRKRERKRRESR